MTKTLSIIIGCICVMGAISVNAQRHSYKIGFSQCVSDDLWRETMEKEMEIELSFHPEMEMVKRDADGDSRKQVEDVRAFLDEGIDILIISPNESAPLTPVVEEVYNSGIPVVVIDRQINSDKWTAYVGADNYDIGRQAGFFAASLLNGTGTILEITGLQGSSPAIERQNGFREVIDQYPDIKIIKSVSGEWIWFRGKFVMDSLLNTGMLPDLVYCHNDFMAAGAYEAAVKHGVQDQFLFIGIDGLPGEEGGIQYVIDGKLDATLLYPTGGDIAIDVAWRILEGLHYERVNTLPTILIDDRNATTLKLQNAQVESMQEKIEKQREIAGNYRQQISNLKLLAILISSFSFIVLGLVILIIIAYRSKQKANRVLENQKLEIEKQNKKLQKISEQLEIATQQKLRFFTNISHEFRTPLTLITGPIETLMMNKNLSEDVKKQLNMVCRNALRLLRLINQIMDFRKLENDKMLLRAGRYDIIKFLKEIKENFDQLAERQKIEFTFKSSVSILTVWFDADKFDKVMFNLLSNAFKVTPENGRIQISVRTTTRTIGTETRDVVEIAVSDNGRGMSEEHIRRIFERFYQIEQHRKDNYFPGTGLGLSLSKGFIELHSGAIEVTSKEGEGTTFYVYLQLGDSHIEDYEKVEEELPDMRRNPLSYPLSEELQYFSTISDVTIEEERRITGNTDKEYIILVVEDNPDLLQYMKESLSGIYTVLTAKNGSDAWEIVKKDLPDLVISDVMMPVMDGLELTRNIKTELSTCHIPVILLTARISVENKLEGLEAGADSYIPKPFNENHLMIRIRKLLEMRKRINEHYKEHLSLKEFESPVRRMDQKFLDRAEMIINKHILSHEFGVEELSGELGLSRVHLYRKIKHLTGLSVSEYIRTVKLVRAKKLMKEGEKTISEVAYASGFSNPSYFTKCFKSQFNQSPSDYMARFEG